MTQSLHSETLNRISEHFAIGPVTTHHPLSGGNMTQTFKLETSQGRFVLRGVNTQNLAKIRGRHAALCRLSEKLPETVPVIAGADGTTVVSTDEGGFELSPFIEGRTWDHTNFPFDDEKLIDEAAALLARLHVVTRDRDDPFQGIVSQPCAIGLKIDQVRPALLDLKENETAQKLLGWLERLSALSGLYSGASVQNAPKALLHGDYGYYNMIFNEKGTQIRALIDFDESWFGPISHDVAFGLFIFTPLVSFAAGKAQPLEKNLARTKRFLEVYERSFDGMSDQRMNLFSIVVSYQLFQVADVLEGLVRGDPLARKNLWLLHWQPDIVEWLVLNEKTIRSAIEN